MNPDKARKLQKYLKPALIPASLIYAGIVNLRDMYYSTKKPRIFNKLKIISIGNIVAGGVGKTPLVIEIADYLTKHGNVCIITNNYPLKDNSVHIVSLEGNILKKPPIVNDEAYMIAKKVPATVIASKNRIAAIELAKGININYVIIDDGLHIRKIKKDLEICVVDKDSPLDNGLYLPAGMIRDTKRALKRCNFIICVDKLLSNNKPRIDCIISKMEIKGLFNTNGEQTNIKGKTAFLFCGIGNPNSFIETAKRLGIIVKGYHFFDDHHIYTKKDLEYLKKQKLESKSELLITTFKDFIKLEKETDLFYIDISLKTEGLDKIMKKVLDG